MFVSVVPVNCSYEKVVSGGIIPACAVPAKALIKAKTKNKINKWLIKVFFF